MNPQPQISPEEQAALFEKIWNKCREDPLFFFEEVLGGKVDAQQREMIQLFFAPTTKKMAVKGGHGAGKDHVASRIALLFHIMYKSSIVVATGPSNRQVQKIVWGEIHNAHRNAKIPLGGILLEKELRDENPKRTDHYMIGYTATDPSAFSGIHNAENILVIVTEAQKIKSGMWAAIESLLTAKNSKLLLIGNAIYEPGSEFYAAFTSKAASYVQYTMPSDKSDYCSKEWVEGIARDYGKDSPYYRCRVLAEFPTDAADTLIPLTWIENAHDLWREIETNEEKRKEVTSGTRAMGVDVARHGDDRTVNVLGTGQKFEVVWERQGQDTMETVGVARRQMRENDVSPGNVMIDEIGVGGGVVDRFRELDLFVVGVNVASLPGKPGQFKNLRSEAYWNLRNMFRDGKIAIDPRDKKLTNELSVLKYDDKSDGMLITSKKELKAELGFSPDRSDALCLCALASMSNSRVDGQVILDRFERKKHVVKLEVHHAHWPRVISVFREQGRNTAAVWMLMDPHGVLWAYDHIEFSSCPISETVGKVKMRIKHVRHVTGSEKAKLVVPLANAHTWIVNVSTDRPVYSGYGAGYPASEIDEWIRLGVEVTPGDGRVEMATDDLIKKSRVISNDGMAEFRISEECSALTAKVSEYHRSRTGEPIIDAAIGAVLQAMRYFTDNGDWIKEEMGLTMPGAAGSGGVYNYAYEPDEETP